MNRKQNLSKVNARMDFPGGQNTLRYVAALPRAACCDAEVKSQLAVD